MIGEPYIRAYCDGPNCEDYETFDLVRMARGWEAMGIESDLKRLGWTIEGDETYCPECSERRKEASSE